MTEIHVGSLVRTFISTTLLRTGHGWKATPNQKKTIEEVKKEAYTFTDSETIKKRNAKRRRRDPVNKANQTILQCLSIASVHSVFALDPNYI